MNKQQDIVNLAKKKGNDADLLLLDKIHAIEDQLAKELPQDVQVEKIAMRLAAKLAVMEKGEKGEKGDSIIGPKGENGKDSTIPGPQGPAGPQGKQGIPGRDGVDGNDGQDADITPIMAQLQSMKRELEEKLAEYDEKIKAIPERPTTTVFGPGKTRIVKYDLSPLLDGATTTFQLGTHFGILSVDTDAAPFGAYREGIDYKEVGKTIVFTANVDAPTALAAGHSLIVKVLR